MTDKTTSANKRRAINKEELRRYLSENNKIRQIIDNIEVSGMNDFSQSDYSNWINLDNQKYFESVTDTIQHRIAYNLQQNGYYNFQIESINSFFSQDSSKNLSLQTR